MSRLLIAVIGVVLVAAPGMAQAPAPRVAPEDMRWVAPGLAGYTDEVLFGDVWRRTDLNLRDRSLVTITALVAGGKTEQVTSHLNRALDNGVRPSEIGGVITHLAFYTGWPNAVSATTVARKVLEARGVSAVDMQTPSAPAEPMRIVRKGSGPVTAGPAANFTGKVSVSGPVSGLGASRLGATVRFEPGARSAWRRHAVGQTLVVTEGCGLTQREGAGIERICAGDVVTIAPGRKHWHGATARSAMTHVALSEGGGVDWLEKVSDAEYAKAPESD